MRRTADGAEHMRRGSRPLSARGARGGRYPAEVEVEEHAVRLGTAEGHERVYTAGQPEAETERYRRASGIPVAPVLAQQCNEVAASLGVKPLT